MTPLRDVVRAYLAALDEDAAARDAHRRAVDKLHAAPQVTGVLFDACFDTKQRWFGATHARIQAERALRAAVEDEHDAG